MSIAGKLAFSLKPSERGDTEVSVRSSRPLHAAHLLEGKSIAQALNTIPLLFSICGKAQSVAAIRAVESSLGVSAGPAVEHHRELLLELETLREHLWRVVLDWPKFYQRVEDTTQAALIVRLANELVQRVGEHSTCLSHPGLDSPPPADQSVRRGIAQLRGIIEYELYGTDLEAWLRLDFDTLQNWLTDADTPLTRMLNWVLQERWQSLGTTESEPLPQLDSDRLLKRLDAKDSDDFIARPDWDGNSRYETGPFARLADYPLINQLIVRFGPGLLVRLFARLVETARLCVQLDSANTESQGTTSPLKGGLGMAEAARGRLYHRVIVRDGTIERYRLLAPTEWNFHPNGPAVQALSGIDIHEHAIARQQADLLIHAIDPCVAYEIHIGDVPKNGAEPSKGITKVTTDA